MNKKVLLAAIIATGLFSACGNDSNDEPEVVNKYGTVTHLCEKIL